MSVGLWTGGGDIQNFRGDISSIAQPDEAVKKQVKLKGKYSVQTHIPYFSYIEYS